MYYYAASQYLRGLLLQTEQRGLSVCLSVAIVSLAKTPELIEMPFGLWTRVDPRKHCGWGFRPPHGKEQFLRGRGGPHLSIIGTTIHIRLQCGLLSNQADDLFCFITVFYCGTAFHHLPAPFCKFLLAFSLQFAKSKYILLTYLLTYLINYRCRVTAMRS